TSHTLSLHDALPISAHEVAAATTADILGAKMEPSGKPNDAKPAEAEPEIRIDGVALSTGKKPPKKPKPITVAAAPIIGNYQLPRSEEHTSELQSRFE